MSKYGPDFNVLLDTSKKCLSEAEKRMLGELTSHSLSRKTWSNYRTATAMLTKCCKEKRIPLVLPVSEDTIITFLLWMISERGAKAVTLNNYLAGIRQLHLARGCEAPVLRSNIVGQLIKGKGNIEAADKRMASYNTDVERKPITPDVLLLLKARLAESDLAIIDKRMLWAVATCLFFGAFRGSEVLARNEAVFDPAFTLLSEDVRVIKEGPGGENEAVQFKLKHPKEDKIGRAILVEVYQSRPDICPVRAFKKWRSVARPPPIAQPAFCWASGVPLTGQKLTEVLRDRLKGYIIGGGKWYSTHSFRIGAASMLGSLGYSDADVKALGRWNSRSFERYIRLPRSRRNVVAKEFSGAL